MSALGKQGIYEIAVQNLKNANYAKNKFEEHGFEVLKAQSFNEFVVKFNQPIKNINLKLAEYGYIGGFDLGEVSDDFKTIC